MSDNRSGDDHHEHDDDHDNDGDDDMSIIIMMKMCWVFHGAFQGPPRIFKNATYPTIARSIICTIESNDSL